LYHRVLPPDAGADNYVALLGDPTVTELEGLIRYLKRWFHFSTPAACVERWRRGQEVDPYTLLLTFDDGYLDMYELLLPVLRRCGVPATVFVSTGVLDGYVTWAQRMFSALTRTRRENLPPFAGLPPMPLDTHQRRVDAIEAVSAQQQRFPALVWDEMISRLCEAVDWDGGIDTERMMNWQQAVDLHRSGWVTVGAHTVTHPMLDRCDREQARRELFEPAEQLRGRLNCDFLPLSYPQGRCPPPEVLEMVREAKYDCAFTGKWGENTRHTPLYELGRRHVTPHDLARASLSLSGLRRKATGSDRKTAAPGVA
jgi:peptidoglycan/xylan/chitin deacetylase (PgdA/CDA1 family)